MTELIKLAHGVWRPQSQTTDFTGPVSALLAGCPAGTVVSDLSAARLHGLWVPEMPNGPLEVIGHRDVPRGADRPGSRRGELRARRQVLLLDEVGLLDGVEVTSEARTWLDLAARLGPADLVALGDSALRGRASIDEMAELVRRAAHRRGVINARRVLPLLDARSRSRPESHLLYILRAAGLPQPAVNVPVYSYLGEWLAEPDLSYADVRLAIEYNGSEHASVKRMRRDMTRLLDIDERGGWRTVVFGPVQVFGQPDQVARYVRQLRADRGAVS